MLKLSTFDKPSKVNNGAGMLGVVGLNSCNAPSARCGLTRCALGPSGPRSRTSINVSGGKINALATRGRLRRAGDTSKATAVEKCGVRGCGLALRWATARGDTAMKPRTIAVTTRRTAVRIRTCANARVLLIRFRVFIFLAEV